MKFNQMNFGGTHCSGTKNSENVTPCGCVSLGHIITAFVSAIVPATFALTHMYETGFDCGFMSPGRVIAAVATVCVQFDVVPATAPLM